METTVNKRIGPRQLRIHDVVTRIMQGPSFSDQRKFGGTALDEQQAHEQYQRWAESWVLFDLEELFPEVKRWIEELRSHPS
jgi:hypothetical protein